MQIRLFQEADTESVVALWSNVFGYQQARNEPCRVIRDKLAVEDDLFYVAMIDDKVIGTVMGGFDGHRGWIYSLAVMPDVRRQGIGSALMRHVGRELRTRRSPKINLQIIASNAAIVPFYEQLGYEIEERISMGKVLEPS